MVFLCHFVFPFFERQVYLFLIRRRGAAYDRHAQDALADDVAQRRAAAKAPSSKQEQTMRALRLNTPAKRAAFGGDGVAAYGGLDGCRRPRGLPRLESR